MKKIFTYIWSAWCIFVMFWLLLLTSLILTVGLNVFGKKSHSTLVWVPYYYSKILLFLWGIKFEAKGLENIEPNKQYIYIFNHASNIDHYLSCFIAPLGRYLAKAELLKVPGYGSILKHLHIPVRRNDEQDRKRSINDLITAINEGKSPIIYPEGTRNKTQQTLLPFKKGAFILSKETNTPIIACTFLNIKEVIQKGYLITPGTVYAVCEAPFLPQNFDTAEDMSNHISAIMLQKLEGKAIAQTAS